MITATTKLEKTLKDFPKKLKKIAEKQASECMLIGKWSHNVP